MNIDTASQSELDARAEEDERQRGAVALGKVHDFLGRFVVYPSKHAQVAHALWVIHAHLMDRWDTTPRLAFLSAEPASGKSRALEITELLVPCPVTAVNVSPAYLFRKVGSEEGATILYDEIDTVFGPKAKDNEEIRALLNAGHRRGAVAGRCVVHGKTVTTEEIPAYSAVAVAGLGWLPDTILSRSVIVRMRRRRVDERVEPYRRRIHSVEGEKIRSLVEVWARGAPSEIDWPTMPPEIQDRDADVWEPLLAIADLAGGDWPQRARKAARALMEAAKEVEPSLGVRLLGDIKVAFADSDFMPTASVLEKLIAMDEAPWGDIRGRPLDARGLARRLREYGIKPQLMRQGSPIRGYRRADFEDAWLRYAPPSPGGSVTSVTSVTPPNRPPDNRSQIKAVTDVTLVTPPARNGAARSEGTLCDHCGRSGADGHWDWPNRPDGVWLHSRCEAPWFDNGGR